MSNMNEKKYYIDNIPASATDIIELAESYSREFNNSCIQQTSVAARILREHGHVVGELKKVSEG